MSPFGRFRFRRPCVDACKHPVCSKVAGGAAEMRRFHEYKKLAEEKGVTGFYAFDVGQDVGFGPLCENLAPCLISHGKLVHGVRDVLATP